ncbi:hypothetical protein ACWC0C_29645 [Streptomyces sp. NPDC001709]
MSMDDRRLIADEETAERIAKARGGDLYDRLFPPRRALSLPALEAAYAEGLLSDQDMAAIFLEVHDAPPTA